MFWRYCVLFNFFQLSAMLMRACTNSNAGKTIISEQDRDLIDHPSHRKITVIPNGVDTSFFQPRDDNKDFDLVFTGNMSYPPNIEAACFLADEVLPRVRQRLPEANLLISGANPVPRVRKLEGNGVTVSGWVEDIRDSYARARIFAAPMLIGTGLQNKLLEAMAMELPCITSPLANNALQAQPDVEISIADSPEAYAARIIELLSNASKRSAIAAAGHQFALQNFNWQAKTSELEQLMNI